MAGYEWVTLLDDTREVSERLELLGRRDSDDGSRDRWHECVIYRTSTGEYVAASLGHSRLPGEVTRSKVHRTRSALELIELLRVRNKQTQELFHPRPTVLALAEAARSDTALRDAYVAMMADKR